MKYLINWYEWSIDLGKLKDQKQTNHNSNNIKQKCKIIIQKGNNQKNVSNQARVIKLGR